MVEGDAARREHTLRSYVDVLFRRKWVVVAAVLAAPAAALFISLRQQTLYQSSAEVLLNQQTLASQLTNTSDPSAYLQPDRFAQTEVDLARQGALAADVLAAAKPALRAAGARAWSVKQFLGASTASMSPNANLLQLSVSAPAPLLATRLATTYAQEFTAYRRRIDSASYERAAAQLESAIKPLQRDHLERSALYASLVEKLQQVRTLEALQTPRSVVQANAEAVQIQPRPKHALMLGGLVGVVIGIVLAFGWEALDPRVRSADEIQARLGLPLLAKVPEPRRAPNAPAGPLAALERTSVDADAFRLLRTNLEFATQAKTIMIAGPRPSEGASTTAANLAMTLSMTGKRVALVDLDLHHPSLHRLFEVEPSPGVTEVVRGEVTLARALRKVPTAGEHDAARAAQTSGETDGAPVDSSPLEILTAGPGAGAYDVIGSVAVQDILTALGRRADVILVDAPPLLVSSDAVTLSGSVDAVVIVTKLGIPKHTLSELADVLGLSQAAAVGVVVTGTERRSEYPYRGEQSSPRTWRLRLDRLVRARPVKGVHPRRRPPAVRRPAPPRTTQGKTQGSVPWRPRSASERSIADSE